MKKTFTVILSAILLIGTLTACFPSYRLTGTAVIQAFGIDLAEEGSEKYEITLQIYEQQGPGAATTIDPSVNNAAVITAKGDTIAGAIDNIVSSQSEYPFTGQNRMLVLGKGLAEDDIKHIFSFFEHNRLTRQNIDVLVAGTTAKEILQINMLHGILSAQTLEDTLANAQERGFIIRCPYYMLTKTMYLNDGAGFSPYMVKHVPDGTEPDDSGDSTQKEKEVADVDQVLCNQIALFKDYALVDVLDEEMSKGIPFLYDGVDKRLLVVENEDGHEAVLNIYKCKTKLRPEYDGETLTFVLKVEARASVEESYMESDYSKPEQLWMEYDDLCSQLVNKETTKAFKKIVNENGCDVFRLAELLQKYETDYYKQIKDNFQEELKTFQFRTEIDLTVERLGMETDEEET